jgi:hypothetical protein
VVSELLCTTNLTLPSKIIASKNDNTSFMLSGVATTLSPVAVPATEQSARPSARGLTEPKLTLQVAKISLFIQIFY